MAYNTESDFFTIVGKYVDGRLEYMRPSWATMFSMIDFLPQPLPTTIEKYEVFNPAQIDLVENAQYSARLISFDDGELVEIIKKIEPDGATE
jgi:hypothetical protein